VLQAARLRSRAQARLAALAAQQAAKAWEQVQLGRLSDWDASALFDTVSALQLAGARSADAYVTDVLVEQGINPQGYAAVDSRAFVGVAGDGRSLLSLLQLPSILAKQAIGAGTPADSAWREARTSLQSMSVTAVQDAGRESVNVATAARRQVHGFTRMLSPPSCARCTVLAGRWYRYNASFARHPHCNCIGIPTNEDIAGDLRTDPRAAVLAGQVTNLSVADTQAIRDGAGVSQVINAQRGMYTADAYGQQVEATRERTARQSGYGKAPRLRPEAIYRLAGDNREEALRLLRQFGYLH
jgi:hypothetical protein